MKCPRCVTNKLYPSKTQSLQCGGCGGQLLEPHMSESLLKQHEVTSEAIKASEASSDIRCPSCGFAMVRLRMDDVTIDACPGCGSVWLDAWERGRVERD
jgi:ribosomal protein S27E